MDDTVTIWDSFHQATPDIYIDPDHLREMESHQVGDASGATTKNQPPPKLLVKDDIDVYLKMADDFLNSKEAESLKKRQVAPLEDSANHNEADVVGISRLWLTSPVLRAINTKYQTNIKLYSEDRNRSGSLRTDVAFKFRDGDKEKTFVHIEYKRGGYVRKKEYTDRMCDDTPKAKQQKLEDLQVAHKPTCLWENVNAKWQVQQSAAYCKDRQAEHGVVCDYRTLVLLKLDTDKKILRAPEGRAVVVDRDNHRKALLGFLIDACDARGLPLRNSN